MKVKKIGHCCLVIEEAGTRIMTDPGSFTTEEQIKEKDIDIILITHEHGDHLHTDSLKEVLKNNPEVKVITNTSVGKILDEEGVKYKVVEDGQSTEIKRISLEAYGDKHAEIYQEIGMVQNTGYFIANKLFYPGDAWINPKKAVDILALPVAGPWVKVKDSTDYLKEINPKKAFPVHDGMIVPGRYASSHRVPKKILEEMGGEFIAISDGEEVEI